MRKLTISFEIFSELNLSYFPDLTNFSVIVNPTDNFALMKPSAPDKNDGFNECFISFIRDSNELNASRRQYNYLGAALEKVTTKGFIAYSISEEFAKEIDHLKIAKVQITVNKSAKTYIYPDNSTKMLFEYKGQLYFGIELDKFYIPIQADHFDFEIKSIIEYYAECNDNDTSKFAPYYNPQKRCHYEDD